MKKQRLPLGIEEEEGFPVSLLKSALQKSIRTNDVKRSLIIARSFLRKSPNQFFRRLPIIILEDVFLHKDFRKIVELAGLSARKSFKLTKEIEFFALTIVEDLARAEIRDCSFYSYLNGYKNIEEIPYVEWADLKKERRELVMAIKYREKMGCTWEDRRMLSILTRIWSYRFSQPDLIKHYQVMSRPKIPTRKSYSNIPLSMTVNDIPLSAVDNHSSPLITILVSKPHVIRLIKQYYPDDTLSPEKRLTSIIWKLRSGVNHKTDYWTGETIDWFKSPYNTTPDADKERYEKIYAALEPEINNIAIWFLEKNK